MIWITVKRPVREYRHNTYASINFGPGGIYFNKMACDLLGFGQGKKRWIMFLSDENDPRRIGFTVLNNPQENVESVYRVSYRPSNNTAKVSAKAMLDELQIMEKTRSVGTASFPIKIDKENDGVYYVELKTIEMS